MVSKNTKLNIKIRELPALTEEETTLNSTKVRINKIISA